MFRTSLVYFLVAILFISISGCSQSHLDIFPSLDNPSLLTKKIEPELLRNDVDAFLKGAQERHPALYQYTSEEAVNELAEQIKSEITGPMTRVEFFRHVGKLSQVLQDGHSFVIWPYQEYSALKEAGHLSFPFSIKVSKEGVFIGHTYRQQAKEANALEFSDSNLTEIAAGSQLISINGVAVNEIINELQQYVGGETQRLRHAFVADRFPPLLWAKYGFIDHFELVLKHKQKDYQMKITPAQAWEINESITQPNNGDEYKLTELTPSTALLNVGSFDVEEDLFVDSIDKSFSTILQKKYQTLIIDIRDNTGGNTDRASYLIQQFAQREFRLGSKMVEKLNQDNRGWFDYKGEPGEFISQDWNEYIDPIDQASRFEGKVYVLIGPATYSASIVFATTVQDFGFATLVGDFTGGYANQTAQSNLFNLPSSQLRAYIPTRMLVRPNGDKTVTQVRPDILITPTLEDLQTSEDTVIKQLLLRTTN